MATRLVQQHSPRLISPHHLDFLVSHRFGALNDGARTFFGLDNASTRIAFEYGVNQWLNVGVGRTTFEKSFDGFVKVGLLKQGRSPVSLTYFSEVVLVGLPWPNDGFAYRFTDRLHYVQMLLFGRKISSRLSLALMPAYVHCNLAPAGASNDIAFVGIGGRFKLNDDLALAFEYSPRVWGRLPDGTAPFGMALNIRTGGHVFQLLLSNGRGLTQKHMFLNTHDALATGRLHFGFNLYRVFASGTYYYKASE